MKRRLSAGEIRFRVSKKDLERIQLLIDNGEHGSVSALLRTLIYKEAARVEEQVLLVKARADQAHARLQRSSTYGKKGK
jgi:Arc/MetJ-type ribon-helix-helix transcriptional regulator